MEKFLQDRRMMVAILIGLGLVAYFNSFHGVFVVDDTILFQDPRLSQPFAYLIAREPVGFTFSLNYLLGNHHPFIFHLTNFFIHLGVVILAYFFLLQVTEVKVAFIAAAIFAVHPLNSEAVDWISGRPYSLGALFLLASFLLYFKALKEKKFFYHYYLSSLACYSIGLLANNKLMIGFLILVLAEFLFGKIKKRWQLMIPYIGLSLLLLLSQIKPFFSRVASQNPVYSGGIVYFSPLRQIPAAIGSYLELFVWPMDLTFYHEDFSIHFLLRLVVTVALFLSLIYLYRKEKLIFFGFAFFILSLIPTLLPIKIAFVVAERYVYFGMVGLCLVAAWILVKGLKKYPQILWLSLALWLALLSARTISRNRDWRTWESLWTATVKVSPTSSMAWNNVGFVYSQKGDYQRAIRAFQQAIKLNPTHTGAHNNLGVAFFKIGEVDQSIYWLEKSIGLRPTAEVYLDLGIAYAAKGESTKAEESFRQALELDPQNIEAFNSLGVLFYHQKKIDEARQMWQQALEIEPFNEEAKKNLIILEQGLQATPSASPQP